jgi:hypothetical protein
MSGDITTIIGWRYRPIPANPYITLAIKVPKTWNPYSIRARLSTNDLGCRLRGYWRWFGVNDLSTCFAL